MNDLIPGSAVYVDSNIFVYFVEPVAELTERADALFNKLAERGVTVTTSELTVAECLYRPAREGQKSLVSTYEQMFVERDGFRLAPLNGEIVKQAALDGGTFGLKLVDAIHFVTALEAGCPIFVTNDSKFKSHPKMRVVGI